MVFSILVALAANRWRDQHKSRQRLAVVEQHIRVEMENSQPINNSHPKRLRPLNRRRLSTSMQPPLKYRRPSKYGLLPTDR